MNTTNIFFFNLFHDRICVTIFLNAYMILSDNNSGIYSKWEKKPVSTDAKEGSDRMWTGLSTSLTSGFFLFEARRFGMSNYIQASQQLV